MKSLQARILRSHEILPLFSAFLVCQSDHEFVCKFHLWSEESSIKVLLVELVAAVDCRLTYLGMCYFSSVQMLLGFNSNASYLWYCNITLHHKLVFMATF